MATQVIKRDIMGTLSSIFPWFLLISFISWMIYALLKIRSEVVSVHRYGKIDEFQCLNFQIPFWWFEKPTCVDKKVYTSEKENWTLEISSISTNKSAKNFVLDLAESNEVHFDKERNITLKDSYIYYCDTSSFFTDSETKKKIIDFYRVEGGSTYKCEERKYAEISVIKTKESSFLFYGLHPIIYGASEGPYTEELIKNLKITELERCEPGQSLSKKTGSSLRENLSTDHLPRKHHQQDHNS